MPPNLHPRLGPLLKTLLLLTILLLLIDTCEGQGPRRLRGRRSRRPNIVYILADDAGWADFESHDPSMATPNIKWLRHEGIFLNQSYVLPMCGPTRSALLTGRYPHTMAMQDNSVGGNSLTWLNETLTLLPQELKNLGYRTHMLGKWHLGFCHPKVLPLGRGFDTFYGFWLGSHNSYYNHTKRNTYDWWDQEQVDFSAQGVYQTDLLNARAVHIIQQSKKKKPFFMYLSYGAPHGPFEVPQHYVDTYCPNITNSSRQIHCGMMAALDEGVGAVIQALKDKGIYDNTIILFMSDNGGPVVSGSVNWPLRGGKKSLFEGGTRSYTIVRAPGMTQTNITWPGMVHAIDWLPTLVEAGGGRRPSYTHGMSHWRRMMSNQEGERNSFIYNVDDFKKFQHMAVRLNQWKLMGAMPGLSSGQKWSAGLQAGWYPPYQMIDNGQAQWESVKVKGSPDEFLLYNIEEDPEERHNVYNERANAGIAQELKNLLRRWVVGDPERSEAPPYPLDPLPINPGKGQNARNGVFKTCWCDLPTVADSNDCPVGGQTSGGGGTGGRGGGGRGGRGRGGRGRGGRGRGGRGRGRGGGRRGGRGGRRGGGGSSGRRGGSRTGGGNRRGGGGSSRRGGRGRGQSGGQAGGAGAGGASGRRQGGRSGRI